MGRSAFKNISAAACLVASTVQPIILVAEQGAIFRAVLAIAAIDMVSITDAFADPAVDGQTTGTSFLGSAVSAVASPANQNAATAFSPMTSSAAMQNATSQYALHMDPATNAGIPNWAAAQNAVLTDPVCNNLGWAGVASGMQNNMLPATQAALTTCTNERQLLLQQILVQGGAAVLGQAIYQAVYSMTDGPNQLVTIAANMVKYTSAAPACNLMAPSDATTVVNSVINGANQINMACASLPGVSPSTVGSILVALSSSAAQLTTITSATLYRQAMAEWQYGTSYDAATYNGQISLASVMGTPTTLSPKGGLSSVAGIGGSPVTAYLNDPTNAPLLANFEQFVTGTSSAVTSSVANCSSSRTSYATTSTGATTQTTPQAVVATPSNPDACPDTSMTPSSIVPDASAVWIYGNASGTCSLPAGTATLYTYVNNTYSTSESVVFYVDGSYTGATIDGTPISNGQTLTLAPAAAGISGMHTITINATGPVVAAGMNGTSTVFDTASGWGVLMPTTTPTANGALAGSATSSGSYQLPAAQQLTTLCNAAIQCLGTQCHSIMANQDQTFGQAMGGLTSLEQMQENAQCAAGTSMAAGNCQPVLFQGNSSMCRTFPGAGWLTNDCCNNPVKTPVLSTVLKIATAAYSVWTVADMSSMVMSNSPSWIGSSYQSVSGWYNSATDAVVSSANQVWSTVTGPFKSMAQSVSNAFGAGGPAAEAGVAALASTVGAPTPVGGGGGGGGGGGPSSGGPPSAVGYVNIVGSMAGLLSSSAIAPTAVGMLTSLLGPAMGPQIAADLLGTTVTDAGIPVITGTTTSAAGTTAADAGTSGILGTVMIVFAIYEIVVLIAQLLTTCKTSEFTFKQSRDLKECYWIGNYCANSALGLCLQTDWVGCCYQSPLLRIIAQQIVFNQPWVDPANPGTAQAPSCQGLTPTQLSTVNWSTINLQEWVSMLINGGMTPTTNTQGSNTYTLQNASHVAGVPNPTSAAQQGAKPIFTAP